MGPDFEQALHKINQENVRHITAEYFAQVVVSDNEEEELNKIKEELAKNTSMSGISNAIWSSLQNALEDYKERVAKLHTNKK